MAVRIKVAKKLTKRSENRRIEHNIQKGFMDFVRKKYPQHFCFKIPNEGKRSFALAAYMKAEGLTAGIPDIFCAVGRIYNGLFMEFKAPGCKPTLTQLEAAFRLKNANYRVETVSSIDQAMQVFEDYLSINRRMN